MNESLNKGVSVVPPQVLSQDETIMGQYNLLKEENEKLLAENEALKINLQKEKFFHQNLYNQWNELKINFNDKELKLQRLQSTQSPKLKIYQYAFYGLLLLIALLVIFNFLSFTNKQNKNSGLAQSTLPAKEDSVSQSSNSAAVGQNINENSHDKVTDKQDSLKGIGQKSAAKLSTGTVVAKYLIVEKSYFYNKPDTNTRRGSFVLPANDSYGIVTALDDRNGFIYIVFKNHAGRTSRGWILKSNLMPVK